MFGGCEPLVGGLLDLVGVRGVLRVIEDNVISDYGEIVELGAGAAVLGHPAASVAMLANMMAARGEAWFRERFLPVLTPVTITVSIHKDEVSVYALTRKASDALPGEMEERVARALESGR